MKYRIVIVSVISCLALIAASSAAPKDQSYTCTYRGKQLSSIYIRIGGYDNNALFCRVFARSSRGSFVRWYGSVKGPVRCHFMMDTMSVWIKVYSRNRTYGVVMCNTLDDQEGWVRIK